MATATAGVTIRTNNVPRELLYGFELGCDKVRLEFDYLNDTEFSETLFFKYRNQWYSLADFIRFQDQSSGWHGYFGLTVWSAIYVKIVEDCESIVVGFAHW